MQGLQKAGQERQVGSLGGLWATACLTEVRRCGQRGSDAGQSLFSVQVGLAGARLPCGGFRSRKEGRWRPWMCGPQPPGDQG